ncbi:MAG: hypothetical protein K8R23_18935 [Chthoniobacter sp.]|nr:hypothetical protein [Chthoniobacter sp.]
MFLTILCATLLMLAAWGMINAGLGWWFPRIGNGVIAIPTDRLVTEFVIWAGVAILGGLLFRAANWVRLTFFAYSAVVTAALLIFEPKEDFSAIIAKLGIACLLLVLPVAHRYYMGRDPRYLPTAEKEPTALRPQARKGKYDY